MVERRTNHIAPRVLKSGDPFSSPAGGKVMTKSPIGVALADNGLCEAIRFLSSQH